MVCLCSKDDDGRCGACIEKVKDAVREQLLMWRRYMEKVALFEEELKAGTCDECRSENFDAAVASLASSILYDLPPEGRKACYCGFAAFIPGDKPMPLFDKLGRDLGLDAENDEWEKCWRCGRETTDQDVILLVGERDPLCLSCYNVIRSGRG